MRRVAMIFFGVLAGAWLTGHFVLSRSFWDAVDPHRRHTNLIGSLCMYVIVPLGGVAGGALVALRTRGLRKADDPALRGIIVIVLGGILGAVLALAGTLGLFNVFDPHPSPASGARMGEGLFACFIMAPLGGLVGSILTYRLIRRRNRSQSATEWTGDVD